MACARQAGERACFVPGVVEGSENEEGAGKSSPFQRTPSIFTAAPGRRQQELSSPFLGKGAEAWKGEVLYPL